MRLAIIIPWFGRELKGGAEQQARQVAARLAARQHTVEVLTTCCRSFHDSWDTNHLPAGTTTETEGFLTHRFPVVPTRRAAFEDVCQKLLSFSPESLRPGVSPVSLDESEIWVRELIKSPTLSQYVAEKQDYYDSFILLPYLYGPVIDAVQILSAKATLQPCLHDEAYAYLPQVADTFYRCGRLAFNSEGELELACRLFGPAILPKSYVIGEGVEIEDTTSGCSDESSVGDDRRFILYLGRKDKGKNLNLLVDAFGRFRSARPNSNLSLVLAGQGTWETDGSNYIKDAGLVSDAEKTRLLRACVALAQPSTNESFSRAMMEAWLANKPVLVHRNCLATATAVTEAAGGLLGATEEEWAANLAEVDRMSRQDLERLGRNGRKYAQQVADWDAVMLRYESALSPQFAPATPPYRGKAIHQFLPNLSYGDAISEYALHIQDELRKRGWESQIFSQYPDAQMNSHCEPFTPGALKDCFALIYHHSTGSDMVRHLASFDGRKALIYHNITPSDFFQPWWPEIAGLLDRGRSQLAQIANRFPICFGVSSFNAQELSAFGFKSAAVLPLIVDPAKWASRPDEATMKRLQDGRTNILYVGRIAPNKKQDDLLAAFEHYRRYDQTARLLMVGAFRSSDPYLSHLRSMMSELELTDSVEITGTVEAARLHAYYRTAHLFWSMSEHEGFGVPLIEAMWFDVPVLAYRSSAVAETLGHAALMFTNKNDLEQLAALAHLVVTDDDLRAIIIKAQRKRREDFTPDRLRSAFDKLIARLSGESIEPPDTGAERAC